MTHAPPNYSLIAPVDDDVPFGWDELWMSACAFLGEHLEATGIMVDCYLLSECWAFHNADRELTAVDACVRLANGDEHLARLNVVDGTYRIRN